MIVRLSGRYATPVSERAEAEHLLQVEREEEEDPEQRGGHDEQRRVGGGQAAVREDPQRDQRILVTAFDHDERSEQHSRDDKAHDRAPRRPAPADRHSISVNTSAIVPSVIATAPSTS